MQISFSKPMKFALALAVIAFFLPASSGAATKKKVWLFADTNVFQSLQTELNQWKTDVNAEGRYDAEIYSLPPVSPELLRLILQLGYQNGDLAGALLVGKMPTVMMESTTSLYPADEPYPTDVYYTDFDCEWSDMDNNGLKDAFGAVGGLMPDIWLGRIDCETLQFPGKTRIDLLRAYFQKDHKYRTGTLSLPKAALLFQAINSHVTTGDFGNLYSPVQLVQPTQATGANYLQKISALPGQEFVYLDCHSYKTEHQTPSSYVYSPDIHAANPKGLFFFLDTCFASHFTAPDYIAGNYLFDSTYGLLAVGATYDTGFHFPGAYQTLSAWAGQDWGTMLLQFPREQSGWDTEYVILGDPTLVPHFNPPAFEIHKPFAFSSGASLKIVRPTGSAAQLWRIPVKARLTTGAGDWLTLLAKNLPAGVAAVPNSFFVAGMGKECDAEVQISVGPTATLGQREITLEATDTRGKLATTTCWIEIIAPPAAKPDFSVELGNPTNVAVVYYGQRKGSDDFGMAVKLASADQATPILLNLHPVNWPAGFEMVTQQYDLSWSGGALLSKKGSPVWLPLLVAVSPTTPVGLYTLTVKATCMGVEKTVLLHIQVLPPYPEITTDPATPQFVPGDSGYVYFNTWGSGYGHVAYATSSIPGISIFKPALPMELLGKHYFVVAPDWTVRPGTYSLLQCKWLDNPAVPAKNMVSMEVLPQYSMTLDQFSGSALGGILKLTIKNQALGNTAYKLNLSVECPSQVTANVSSAQVMASTTRYGTTEAFVFFTTHLNIASLLGRSFPFTITVKAKSPDYPWPEQSASASFEVPQIPYIPLQYSLVPIKFIPQPDPSPLFQSNIYRTPPVIDPVSAQLMGTIGR